MKQLLIVNSAKPLNYNSANPENLSTLDKGAITFFEVGKSSPLSTIATKNFGIALGRGNNSPAFVIPEVDVNTLEITHTLPIKGRVFTAKITVPSISTAGDYTIVLIKKNTVPHERNTWTATINVPTSSAMSNSEVAAALRTYFKNMADSGSLDIVVSGTSANVIITGKNVGEAWTLKGADELMGVAATDVVEASPAIGDKNYIQELASKCAAGKGFTDVYQDGDSIYPGYPEAVEDLVLNSSDTPLNSSASNDSRHFSTTGYKIYTLRFQVGRDSAKTRDEKVWQVVHIAVPLNNASISTINSILPSGRYIENVMKSKAASTVMSMVTSSALK